MNGVIFDLKRFAVHDGTGLRTTLFLKGCPLRCPWCQNPEGLGGHPIMWNDPSNCLRCGYCVQACPENALKLSERIYLDINACKVCGKCEEICPSGAMRMVGKRITSQEAANMLLRDRVFFADDGGVTLSGGEVLAQWQFAREILEICHREKVNTAIETSLFADQSVIEALLPVVDQFIIDIKYLDKQIHKTVIGVDNQKILDNYCFLVEQGANVLVRTPLIPGFTATEKNIRDIAGFVFWVDPNAKYELLNFNPLCRSKYAALEQEYSVQGAALSSEEMNRMYEIVQRTGLKKYGM